MFLVISKTLLPEITGPANTQYQEIKLLRDIALGQGYFRSWQLIKALGHSTAGALKMDVVIVVAVLVAMIRAKRIAGASVIYRHFMQQALIHKRTESTVYGHPVVIFIQLLLQISMRQGMRGFDKGVKHIHPGARKAKVVAF
jgi:hypothetical protein